MNKYVILLFVVFVIIYVYMIATPDNYYKKPENKKIKPVYSTEITGLKEAY